MAARMRERMPHAPLALAPLGASDLASVALDGVSRTSHVLPQCRFHHRGAFGNRIRSSRTTWHAREKRQQQPPLGCFLFFVNNLCCSFLSLAIFLSFLATRHSAPHSVFYL